MKEVFDNVVRFILTNWSDLSVVAVGFVAWVVYRCQKRDQFKAAATLIVGQIGIIEERITILRNDPQLGNIAVYNSQIIINENMWEQYKHLFVKKLSNSDYELLQKFFEEATLLERIRNDMVGTVLTAWKDKSAVEHQIVGQILVDETDMKKERIAEFRKEYRPMELVFTPDVAANALVKKLANFQSVSGTTAYKQMREYSYYK